MKSALNYIPEGQMSIFDYVEPKEKVKPKFKKGQRVYRLILDVVETGKITGIWDFGGKYFGYRTDEDNITFWDRDLHSTVFTSKEQAYAKANSLKDKFIVTRTETMKVIDERNFVEICDDSRILISATVKFLEGNMIYFNGWYTYHFLKIAKSEEKARKLYEEKANDILKEMNDKRFEVEIPVELKDMYLCQNEIWSEYRYVAHNGAKRG